MKAIVNKHDGAWIRAFVDSHVGDQMNAAVGYHGEVKMQDILWICDGASMKAIAD